MPVPFGFSVGDCISVCILIKDAIRALDSTRGSASEYQEVIRELWALDRAILEVVNLAQGFETTVELNALIHTTKRTAEQCKTCIEGFLERIKGYEGALRGGGSGNMVRDVKGKVGWALCGREHLARFRTQINGYSSVINMLLITVSVSLTKLNDKNLKDRMESTRRANEEASREQIAVWEQVKDTLDEHTRSLQAQGNIATRLAERMKYFFALGTELKSFMIRIWTLNIRSYKVLLDLQTRVPREFEPCWIQEPLILTDALGRIAPVHLELINSWEVFDSVLAARFRNIPGERKIQRREYALQDRGSLRDLERSEPFEASFLPGRRVDMSMVFERSHSFLRSCPGCRMETKEENAATTICKSCGLWFQRIEELVDQQQPRASIVEPMFETTEKAGALVATRHQLPISKPKPLDKKRKLEKADFEENMNMFKRVRLFEHKHIIKHLGGLSPSEFRRREAARRLRYEPPPPGVESCQLQSACFRGSVAEVQALLQRGFDVNGIGTWSVEGPYPISSCTALEAAVEAGNLATVEHLLKHGANPYTRHVMWGMPLTSAVRQGNIELVKTMLLHGIDANPKYRCIGYHTSALQRASYDENLAMIKLLVYYGADVNASAGYFGRALEAAAVTGNSSTAEYLLDAGANVNAFNELIPSKLTALARAIFKDHRLMVRLLIARGADIRLYCEQGGKFRNAVQCAAYYGREEILDYLVDEEGADIYQSSPSYTNSLQAAVQGAQERIFHNLIGRGMDIKMPCVYSDNLLHVAASGGAFGIVEYLLDQGIDVNMEGSYYGSALIAAATAPSHRDSVCRILIDRGADLLVSHERRGFALHTAVESGCLLTVELLLDAGLPINAVGGKYATALQAAALNTPEPVVLLLLERGANINIQGGYFGNALQAWSYVGNEYIVKLLLEAGADPSARGGYYETALIAAVHEGYDNIVELLLTYGASFDAVSPNYGSALDCAESLWRDDQPESDLMKRARIKSLLTSRSSLRMKVLFP